MSMSDLVLEGGGVKGAGLAGAVHVLARDLRLPPGGRHVGGRHRGLAGRRGARGPGGGADHRHRLRELPRRGRRGRLLGPLGNGLDLLIGEGIHRGPQPAPLDPGDPGRRRRVVLGGPAAAGHHVADPDRAPLPARRHRLGRLPRADAAPAVGLRAPARLLPGRHAGRRRGPGLRVHPVLLPALAPAGRPGADRRPHRAGAHGRRACCPTSRSASSTTSPTTRPSGSGCRRASRCPRSAGTTPTTRWRWPGPWSPP